MRDKKFCFGAEMVLTYCSKYLTKHKKGEAQYGLVNYVYSLRLLQCSNKKVNSTHIVYVNRSTTQLFINTALLKKSITGKERSMNDLLLYVYNTYLNMYLPMYCVIFHNDTMM